MHVDGEVQPKLVEELFVREGTILDLTIAGRVIHTTPEHPFYVRDRGWTPAGDLAPGDLLGAMDGSWLLLQGATVTGLRETVYNLRVADFQTYFVGSDEWGFAAWVHNQYTQRETQFRDLAEGIYADHLANGGRRGVSPTTFWQKIFKGDRRTHVLDGDSHSAGHVGGVHWADGNNVVSVTKTSQRRNRHGAYNADVAINDTTRTPVTKMSTVFGDHLTRAEVHAEIYSAYLNARHTGHGNRYIGVSHTGQKIMMYLRVTGTGPSEIISAFPHRR